jgi:hypothetical protein
MQVKLLPGRDIYAGGAARVMCGQGCMRR